MGRAYQNRKESIAKTSDQKAKVYSKYGREIYVVAKAGGNDPSGNLALRSLIDRAKKDQVPSHVIEKALQKSEGVGGEDYSAALYEGFGPGGCAVLISCLTDNPNRTFGDLRTVFNKTKCKLGTSGTVSHMFDHLGVLSFAGDDEEAALEALLNGEVDVTDIENEDGKIIVYVPNTEHYKAKQALTEALGEIEFDIDEIQYLGQMTTPISGEDIEVFNKLYDLLDDLDDVQKIYHNAEF